MKKGDAMGARKRILVVDDEEMILDILTSLLEEEGYEVVTAQHPGLAVVRSLEVDLIILDLKLSGRNDFEGKAVLNRLWEDKCCLVPVIIYSAHICSKNVSDSINEIVHEYGNGRNIYKCVEKGGGVMNLINAVNDYFSTEDVAVPAG
jgi:CheY-like chemotaxis protein